MFPWMSFFHVKPWSRAGAFARGRGGAGPRMLKVGDTAVHSAMAWKPGVCVCVCVCRWDCRLKKKCQLWVMSSPHACLTFGGIQPTREALMGVVSCDKMSCSGSDERYHPTPMTGMLGCWLFYHSLPDSSTAFFSEICGVTKSERW